VLLAALERVGGAIAVDVDQLAGYGHLELPEGGIARLRRRAVSDRIAGPMIVWASLDAGSGPRRAGR
jgi:hypothetical protein